MARLACSSPSPRHWLMFSVVLLLLSIASLAGAAQVIDKIVASVNGEIVTLSEINAELEKLKDQLPPQQGTFAQEAMLQKVRESILERRIQEILIKQEIERLELEVETVEVESRIREFREKNNMDEETFRAQLAMQGKTRPQFMKELEFEILKSKVINYNVHRNVFVTDAEIEAFAAGGGVLDQPTPTTAPESPVPGGGKVRLQLIMVDDAGLADRIHADIAAGKMSFAEAARQHSIGPGKEEGGTLGAMSLGDLAAPMRQALQGLSPGEVSAPFKLEAASAIIRLMDRPASAGAPATPSPTAVGIPSLPVASYDKDAIRRQLEKQKTEQLFRDYMAKLKSRSLIEINW